MEKNDEKSEASILRKKAEKLQKEKRQNSIFQPSETDVLRLIHELEVHQIELELQNEELKTAKENEAVAANAKYTVLYDFAPSGYYTLSPKSEIIDINLCGAQMLGKERLFLKNNKFSNYVSEDTKAIFQTFLQNIFNGKTKESCEISLSINDCSPIFVHLTGIINENKEQCLVIAVDLSERKIAEDELIKAKEKAEESDRLKTAFLHNISHEIRSPMNAIMGFSDLLSLQYNNKHKLEKFSGIIKQRCKDLLHVINDILDIAKIESGQLSVNLETCNLCDLFSDLKSFFKEQQSRIGKQHIKFNLQSHCSPADNYIVADEIKLEQIFINLIDNAFKFTESGKIEGGCRIQKGKGLVFYVSDTGIGIPHDKQKAIFDSFTQLHQGNTSHLEGTGLGLSIVKGLLDLMGGEIFLESEPGKGSTFSFSLPYKRATPLLNKPLMIDEVKTYNFQDKNILLVEDDPINAEFIKEILQDTGGNIIHTRLGNEAVKIASSKPLDLILMDIRLPDMTGLEVTSQIKNLNPNARIIAQTAYADGEDKQKILAAGCVDYISKPIDWNLLLSMMNKHLSNEFTYQSGINKF